MAQSSALSRKDMREPDRFQVVANRAAAWLSARKKPAILVGGAVALLVVAAIATASVRTSRAEAAGRATSALLDLVAAPIVAKPAEGATSRSFPTEEAKERAVVAEADQILAKYGAGRSGLLAVLVKGDALYELKEWDKAQSEYERYLGEAQKGDSLRFGALEDLGLVAEAKGDLEGAARAYERMGREAPPFADRADLERARVLAAAGKIDEARQILLKFAENHKDSSLVGQASQRLERLGAK